MTNSINEPHPPSLEPIGEKERLYAAQAERIRQALLYGLQSRRIHALADVARRCGVSTAAVARWQKYGRISRTNALTLADICGVDARWLITGYGEMVSPQPTFDPDVTDAALFLQGLDPAARAMLIRFIKSFAVATVPPCPQQQQGTPPCRANG